MFPLLGDPRVGIRCALGAGGLLPGGAGPDRDSGPRLGPGEALRGGRGGLASWREGGGTARAEGGGGVVGLWEGGMATV